MIAVFDTNIVIDALNGLTDADVEYSRYARVLISHITWIEVMVGVREDEAQVRNLLETRFEMIPLDLAVAEKSVDLRRSYRLASTRCHHLGDSASSRRRARHAQHQGLRRDLEWNPRAIPATARLMPDAP